MTVWGKVEFSVLFVYLFTVCAAQFQVPPVTFTVLKRGGFRATISAKENISEFKFHANIEQEIKDRNKIEIVGKTQTVRNGQLVLDFPNKLQSGQVLFYSVFVTHNRLGYRRENEQWKIKQEDLLDNYPSTAQCDTSTTVINGGESTCSGTIIFEDNFEGSSIDTESWMVEKWIPLTGEFNSFEIRPDTQFTKGGVLYLKPIAVQEENEVRGTLDLRNGCTSTDETQCLYESYFSFLLPPVKSAKITSKISFKYGKVEILAKLPAGEWIFPVIELVPKDKGDSEDPTKIIIAHSRGNDRLTGTTGDDIGSRYLFAGPIIPGDIDVRKTNLKPRPDSEPYNTAFHVYTVEWLPDKLKFYFDNAPYGEVDLAPNSPFHKEYFLTLGVAVGGLVDFPDGYKSGSHTKPWLNGERNYLKKFFDARNVWSSTWSADNPALRIDYVKIYAI